jgi:iron complex transport system substrate-binding protein
VVGGRDTSALSAAEIDDYVRSTLASGGDLYTLHEGALTDLDPELILTQDLCRVCAVPTGQVREAVDHLGCTADVVTLDPYSLAEVLDTIDAVARAAGVPERAGPLLAGLRGRLEVVAALVAGRSRPRVAVIEWVDPVFGAGHWMPDMVEVAGGTPVACRPRQASTAISWDDVRAAQPDVVVVSPCGFDLEGAVAQAAGVTAEVPGAEVWAVDGDALMVRPGPRLVDGVETLAAILHPDLLGPAADASSCRRVSAKRLAQPTVSSPVTR